jgi:predicted PurR-regulated permease PerM
VNERGATRVMYRGGLFLVVVLIVSLILRDLIPVLMQLFAAGIIAAAMAPAVNVLLKATQSRWRWHLQRGLVVVIAYLLAAVVVTVFGFLIVRAIVREAGGLLQNLPAYAEAFQSWLASVVAAYPGLLDPDLQSWIVVNMQATFGGVTLALNGLLGFVGFAASLFGGFLTVLFTVFMAIYLTVDASRMRDYLVVFWPTDRRPQVSRVANGMAARLSQWAVGQGLLCVIIGGGAWLGSLVIGIPYPALIGLIWALAEFVPGIGPFVSAIPTILLGFAVSPTTGVAAAAFTLIWSQVENNIITPKVLGNAVEVHPFVILVALIVGAQLLGPPGALLAIPFVATAAVLVDEIRTERMRQGSQTVDGRPVTEPLPEFPPLT